MATINTLDLIDAAIADLEAKLHLSPGASLPTSAGSKAKAKAPKKATTVRSTPSESASSSSLPDILKLEFKVGVITKVWDHPDADKLYCEEIDVGEPRLIASGLRPHFSEEQMLGRRVLVVTNLKPKKLVGFKSHGMVLCAEETTNDDGTNERVELVEPPEGATPGEVVSFEGLPSPQPWSPAQVEKKKVFAACMPNMRTTKDRVATWNGHAFLTSHGPCKCKSIAGGALR